MDAWVSIEITHNDDIGRGREKKESCGELVQGITEDVSGVGVQGKIDRNKIDRA